MAQLPIEPDYGRFIPPQVDDFLEETTEDDWKEGKPAQELIENDDGSVTVVDPEEESSSPDFLANLAEDLGSHDLSILATEYTELIERDKEARELRDKQYEEGIRRTGLSDDAPGGAQFQGASKVVHPVLAEGCVDFASRAIKELCPPNGPVKTQIIGKTDGKKLQRATRKRDFLNWQLTKQCPEFFTEMEQMLSQLPLGGSQYIKVLPNQKQRRPEFEFVPVDKLLVPFAATSFYTAQRITHVQEITEQTFNERIESGYYRDVAVFSPNDPEETKAEKASNKVEGKESGAYNEDGLRTIYEITCYAKLKFDKITEGELAPYVIVIDESLNTVLAVYRNWSEKDDDQQKLDWMVEFKFLPWRGAYGIGLPHLIGGLAAALTGALRALMDSAHVNNAPTLLKLKGARFSGQTASVDVTQIQEVEGMAGVDDVRKLLMPMPFNPPSQVLFQLLDWLTNAAKGVVATAEEKIADASNQMPVGTALALIEQGSITYSAIHMRSHNSMAKLLEIVCRINYDVLNEEEIVEQLGEEVVFREDFKSASDVIPVSDPNIFSEAQRYAQIQAVMQLMQVGQPMGVKYNINEVHRRALELMKVKDIDDILPPEHKPIEMNAIAENVTAMLGNQVLVFPEQDHISHIETHLRFITDPNFGGNILVAQKTVPQLLDHIGQHIAFLYAHTCNEVANTAIPMGVASLDMKRLDEVLAAVSARVAAGSKQLFQPIMQMLAQAQQNLQLSAVPPPMDPAVQVQKEIGMAEIERQKAKDAGEIQLKTKIHDETLQTDVQKKQADMMEHVKEQEAALQQEQIDNQKDIEKLRQSAQDLKQQATDMLQKAANNQQKVDLEKQQQEIDYQLKVAELKQRETQFLQKQLVDQAKLKQTDMQTILQHINSGNAAEIEEPVPPPTLGEELAPVIQAMASQQNQMMEMQQAMMAGLSQLGKALTAPKLVVRDNKGKAVGVQTLIEGNENVE